MTGALKVQVAPGVWETIAGQGPPGVAGVDGPAGAVGPAGPVGALNRLRLTKAEVSWGTGDSNITGWTVVENTGGWTESGGIWTCAEAGTYAISCRFSKAAGLPANVQLLMQVTPASWAFPTVTGTVYGSGGTGVNTLAVGNTVAFIMRNLSGAAVTSSMSAEIVRVDGTGPAGPTGPAGDFPIARTTWPSPINSGLTVGSGTVTADYYQIGKQVNCEFLFVFGTGSVVGSVVLNAPVTTGALGLIGLVRLRDGTVPYLGYIVTASTTTFAIRAMTAGGTYVQDAVLSTTVPFAWATGDSIHTTFSYIAA